jgi:hypothetical protein
MSQKYINRSFTIKKNIFVDCLFGSVAGETTRLIVP